MWTVITWQTQPNSVEGVAKGTPLQGVTHEHRE